MAAAATVPINADVAQLASFTITSTYASLVSEPSLKPKIPFAAPIPYPAPVAVSCISVSSVGEAARAGPLSELKITRVFFVSFNLSRELRTSPIRSSAWERTEA